MIGALSNIPGIGQSAGSGLGSSGIAGLSGAVGGLPVKADASADISGSFSAILGNFGANTIGALNNAETLSVKALQGETDTRAVVDAVMSAEQALNTAIAIRDKIVTAYLEVSRMAI